MTAASRCARLDPYRSPWSARHAAPLAVSHRRAPVRNRKRYGGTRPGIGESRPHCLIGGTMPRGSRLVIWFVSVAITASATGGCDRVPAESVRLNHALGGRLDDL